MIVFEGYITGTAERFLKKKILSLCFLIVITASVLVIPISVLFEKLLPLKGLTIILNLISPVCGLVACFIIFSKKKYLNEIKPKRVFVNNTMVSVEINKRTESRLPEEVKEVHDHGDFYVICFSNRKSFQYICQKNLISKGSVEEFERLFEGRIVKEVTKK